MATLKHEPNRLATLSAERQGKASASSVKLFSADSAYEKNKELLSRERGESDRGVTMEVFDFVALLTEAQNRKNI